MPGKAAVTEHLIRNSVEHLVVGTKNCQESYIDLNRYLVEHAKYMVAVSEKRTDVEESSFQVTAYAKEKGVEIMYIHPDTAEVSDAPQ